MGRTFATRAIADLMRIVGRLSVDASADPALKPAHRHFINGYLAALEAAHVVPHTELARLLRTCEVLLDGNLTLVDLRLMKKSGNDTDPLYLRAVTLVNRACAADAAPLAAQLSISPGTARQLIERMEADGLVNPPDLFGVRTLKLTPEVRHG